MLEVLESIYRLDLLTIRNDERRVQSISYTLGFLAVLTVVHVKRDNSTRTISFRRAGSNEREVYYDWLKNKYNES